MFSFLYNLIIHDPLLNALVFLYQTAAFEDLGVAIILLTVLIRFALFPLFQRSMRHQMLMQRLQPKLKKIKEQHKDNLQKQSEAMMSLFREHKANPFSGFLLLLVQIPVIFAVYRITLGSLEPDFLLNGLYPFVSAPETLNAQFLGLINLGGRSMLIVGLAAAAQYVQGRLGTKRARTKAPMSAVERMSEQMVYLAPVFTFAILVGLPAAVGLYWVATSAFSIVQQLIINRQLEHGKFGNLHQENG